MENRVILLSLFDLYQVQRPVLDIDFLTGILFVIWVVITVTNLLMVYNICAGIAEMARSQGKIKLQEDALAKWKYYLWANILILILTFVIVAIPPLAAIIVLLLLITFIVVLAMMMMLMKQAGEELSMRELA